MIRPRVPANSIEALISPSPCRAVLRSIVESSPGHRPINSRRENLPPTPKPLLFSRSRTGATGQQMTPPIARQPAPGGSIALPDSYASPIAPTRGNAVCAHVFFSPLPWEKTDEAFLAWGRALARRRAPLDQTSERRHFGSAANQQANTAPLSRQSKLRRSLAHRSCKHHAAFALRKTIYFAFFVFHRG